MTCILHISDTHIVREGQLVSRRLETADALKRLVDRIVGIRRRIGPIDAVLVSGDLSHDGSAESYSHFKALMAPLDFPLLVVPGNHDIRSSMREAFADSLPPDGPLNWCRHIVDITIIGLDTLVEGHGHGTLAEETLNFLHDALMRTKGLPVLLALHHPPFASGIAFMDDIGLTNCAAFRDVIAGHERQLRIICGHVHSMMVTDVAGHVAISSPSPCSTFAFDRRADAPAGFMAMGDGCLLHRWDAGFHTVRIGPDGGTGPFPF